jgi:integrase
MLGEWKKFERGETEAFTKNLPKKEQQLIADYVTYRKARGMLHKDNIQQAGRILGQMRYILERPLTTFTLKDIRELLSIINSSSMSNYYRNTVKCTLKNFIKFAFADWSIRFSNLEDVVYAAASINEKKINHSTIIKKEELAQLVRAETKNFWRAFLLTQYEGGLRTGEARFLKWSDLKLNIGEELTEVNIFAGKTQKGRTIYLKEATHYINLLRSEQENLNTKGVYVFGSRTKKDQPIEKDTVNKWFRTLTEKTLGRKCWNYLLRHSRATELYGLAEANKISKDTVVRFMGHSDDMSKVYKHPNPDDVKKMLRDQVYNIEDLPHETKRALEIEVEKLKQEKIITEKKMEDFEKRLEAHFKKITKLEQTA